MSSRRRSIRTNASSPGAAARRPRLLPHLDGKGDDDQRMQHVHERPHLPRWVSQVEPIAVRKDFMGTREHRLIEDFHVLHTAPGTLPVTFLARADRPWTAYGFEVGELLRK